MKIDKDIVQLTWHLFRNIVAYNTAVNMNTDVITSAEGGYVFTSVCLFVCLSVCLSVGVSVG